MATWREKITREMHVHGDDWNYLVSLAIKGGEPELDREFYDGYGGTCGTPFTLWTKKRVYFPVEYDGAEWAASVSRSPDGIATGHV